jgi:hypothetical protein
MTPEHRHTAAESDERDLWFQTVTPTVGQGIALFLTKLAA